MKKALGFLLLFGLAVGLFLILRPRPVPPPRILHPTPQQAALAQRHIEHLRELLTAPATPAPPPAAPSHPGTARAIAVRSPGLRTLRLTEDDLNIYLTSNRSAHKMLASKGVQAVQVTLQEPANFMLRAAILLKGHPQNVELSGALAPDPQIGLRFTATHAQIGRLSLPNATVTAQANAVAARYFHKMQGRLPMAIQSVRVQGKELILTGLPVTANAALSPRSESPGRR